MSKSGNALPFTILYASAMGHKSADVLLRKEQPAFYVVVYNSEPQKHKINAYRHASINQLMQNGVNFNAPLLVAARFLNRADEMGIVAHLVSYKDAQKFKDKIRSNIESAGKKKEPAPVEKVEPIRAFEHSSKPLYVEPRDVKQVGRVVTREVETRVDQSDFKRRVTLNYGGKCAITGHEVAQTLQAAHIAAFATDRNNNTSNGILMDVALHVLFDAGLMAINPENMCVYFNCQHPLAQQYGGKPIAAPRVALDVEALTIRWNRFK